MDDPDHSLNDSLSADLLLAQQWFARLTGQGANMGPAEAPLPKHWINAAAQLVGLLLNSGRTVQIVVPDDETLPELSNALDIDLRPLCLVLPEAEFVTRIALRATLTLLKSRLARQADNSPVWQAQQARITQLSGSWQEALTWGQSETSAIWPTDIAHLFPARLLPVSHALAFNVPCDVQVLIAPERMPAEARDALANAPGVLCLSAFGRGSERRQLIVFDEAARELFELDVLTREVAELELELSTAQAEVVNFSQRYYAAVGSLMVELDQLVAQLAEQAATQQPDDAALKEAARSSQENAQRSQQEQRRFEEVPRPAQEKTFAPAASLKKLYRQLAQKIHPDRADNDAERDWRTQLMAEATRAYRSEDEPALQAVLQQWQAGQHAEQTENTEPSHSGERSLQLQRLRARLGQIQTELDKLLSSRLYELLIANRLATRQGRDLLKEIAGQIEQQITAARAQLDVQATANSISEDAPC